VSDRLDIVRLIDSKVTATRRTVARSKQLVDAAKDDLTTYEEWLERHRRGAQEDSERYQRRLGRRRRIEGCKRLALWLLLLVPSACAAMFRAACRGLAAVGEAFYFSCCWIGTTARALCRRLIRLITGGVSMAGTTLLPPRFGLSRPGSAPGQGAPPSRRSAQARAACPGLAQGRAASTIGSLGPCRLAPSGSQP